MTNNLNPDALTGLLDKNPKLTSQNRERFRESIRKVTSEYMQLNGILSVVVGGSVARGVADNESDIEMYVYCHNQIPSQKDVKKVMDNLGARLTRSLNLIWHHAVWEPHTFFAIDDVSFELGYRVFPKVESKVRRYLTGKDIYSHHTKEGDTPLDITRAALLPVSCHQRFCMKTEARH